VLGFFFGSGHTGSGVGIAGSGFEFNARSEMHKWEKN
jgi:hypothetical protein